LDLPVNVKKDIDGADVDKTAKAVSFTKTLLPFFFIVFFLAT
jgi:hypothetical protein